MSAPRSARDRVRAEVRGEILAAARARLAQEGAAALSLRSIARDLDMAPSALYRYFDGRDAILSALILEAYTSLADQAEAAAAGAAGWSVVPGAMRDWALAHPHEWGLIFGSPVPGDRAPEETVVPYARVAGALVRPIAAAHRDGRLRATETDTDTDAARSPALDAALAPVHDALLPGVPGPTVQRALEAWCTLVGAISLEVFGHWRNTVLDPALFFDCTVETLGAQIGVVA